MPKAKKKLMNGFFKRRKNKIKLNQGKKNKINSFIKKANKKALIFKDIDNFLIQNGVKRLLKKDFKKFYKKKPLLRKEIIPLIKKCASSIKGRNLSVGQYLNFRKRIFKKLS